MDDRKYKEKLIEDRIVDRNNDCAYRYLLEHSTTYKDLESANNKLAKQFPCVLNVYENSVRDNRSYTIDEVKAVALYIQNERTKDDLERYQIYLYGLKDSIKLLMEMHFIEE